MELHEVLSDAIAAKKWTIRETARQAGVSVSYLHYVLAGKERPSERILRTLAELLSLDGDELVIMTGRLFPEGSTRRTAAELLAQNRELRRQLAQGPAGVAS